MLKNLFFDFHRMTGMVLEKIIVPDVQKVGGNIERKIAACGMIKLICECPIIFSGAYQKFWGPLVEVNFINNNRLNT